MKKLLVLFSLFLPVLLAAGCDNPGLNISPKIQTTPLVSTSTNLASPSAHETGGAPIIAPPQTTSSPPIIILDQPFKLAYQQTAYLKTGDLTIKFAEANDSRCPAGAQCFVAGKASAKLQLTKSGQDLGQVEADLPSNNDVFVADGYIIRLLALDPFPSPAETKKTDYVATLSISKK